VSDLECLYEFAFGEWQKDREYFKKTRATYIALQTPHVTLQKKIDATDLTKVADAELFAFIQKALTAVTTSVGIGHLIEGVAILADEHLKSELTQFTNNSKDLNEAFVVLTTPSTRSFAQDAEDELREISVMTKNEKKLAIQKYIAKWGWIRNSYAGRRKMTEDEVAGEVNAIKRMKRVALENGSEKDQWIKKLKLPQELIERFDVLAFITDWQDERKKYILNAVDRLESLLEELSRRTGIPLHDLRYGMSGDFNDTLPQRAKELAFRRSGVLCIAVPDEFLFLTGKEYEAAMKTLTKEHTHEGDELRGMAASLGTVRGRVRVCTTLESLNEIEEGDILVASMTRPEYLPAMKKAAAFVTDEGGITCHAAIVAREMGKPCIIGTKVATKVLKNGDLVEVKGNHGVVLIKERARK
jgi:phosphoenolpyruvate synthase/pyruvate phosphate dikinase